ncbi:hypothetical protein D3C76_1583490 [compost metagenome]
MLSQPPCWFTNWMADSRLSRTSFLLSTGAEAGLEKTNQCLSLRSCKPLTLSVMIWVPSRSCKDRVRLGSTNRLRFSCSAVYWVYGMVILIAVSGSSGR